MTLTQRKEKGFDKLVDALILEVLDKKKSVERQEFKKIIYDLTDRLYSKKIFLPIDFRVYKDEIDSNALDDALMYLTSAGIVEIVSGSIIYKLSEMAQDKVGVGTYLDIIYKAIPSNVESAFRKEVQRYCVD